MQGDTAARRLVLRHDERRDKNRGHGRDVLPRLQKLPYKGLSRH